MTNNICRTCLSSTVELLSVFDEVYVNSDSAEIIRMILLCTGLEISKYDEFSHFICYTCTDKVIKSYEFREKCWKSQLFLMEQYKADGKYEVSEEELLNVSLDNICVKREDDIHFQDANITETDDINNKEIDVVINNIERKDYPVMDENKQDSNEAKLPVDTVFKEPPRPKRRILPSRDEDILEYVIFTLDETCMYGKRYYCLMCDQVYVRPMTIRDHLIKIHKIELKKRDGFECKICSKVFDQKDRLANHQKVHAPAKYVCDICGAVLKAKEMLAEHKRRHTGEKPYKCQICDFRAAHKSSLEVHKRVHTGEKPYKCHICGIAFKTSSGRANHRRQHSDERPFECLICKKTFKTRGVYRGHMKTHDSNQSIECEFCQKKFPPGRIKFHLRQHSAKPTYKCDLCGKMFFQRISFQTHMKNRHFIEDKDM